MDVNKLQEIIEDAGYETRRYSGRSMYGAECVGFEVPSGTELGVVAQIVFDIGDDLDRAEMVRQFQTCRMDSMGRDDIIIYFPRSKYPKS